MVAVTLRDASRCQFSVVLRSLQGDEAVKRWQGLHWLEACLHGRKDGLCHVLPQYEVLFTRQPTWVI